MRNMSSLSLITKDFERKSTTTFKIVDVEYGIDLYFVEWSAELEWLAD